MATPTLANSAPLPSSAAPQADDPSSSAPADASVPAVPAEFGPSIWLADLSWTDVAAQIAAGTKTVLIPTGGTEQNGPHMALGKHNVVVEYTAEQIARRSGAALVAPVMDYVPEGDPAIRDGHLQWAGTISVPPAIYAQVLEATAESLAGHGFTLIVLIGDSGSSQATQASVAADLTQRWADRGVRVINLDAYYQPVGQREIMYAAGISDAAIGSHAGAIDTSEVMALRPDLVDQGRASAGTNPGSLDGLGVDGDARLASAQLGQQLLELKITAGLGQLQAIRGY